MPRKRQPPSPRKPAVPQLVRVLTGIRLDLAAIAAAPSDDRSWVQVARVGRFKGYRSGPIEFTPEYFDQLIKNFRAHPSFALGPDGYGADGLVRYDFDHGSEDGEVDQTSGEPAASWVCDLEKRLGANGVVELWALTQFLEPARTYILEQKYKWTSVAIWPNAIDPDTGKDIGPLLTSVAFTNDPFIRGMAPIAIAASMWFDKASNPEDALNSIRGLFGLPQLTDVATVQAEIGKLKTWLDAGTLPPGVDGDELVGGLKQIFGLPVLATSDEVFAELVKLVPALADHQAQERAEGGDMPGQSPAPTMASNRPETNTMKAPNRITLARSLSLPDDASDEAILLALDKMLMAAKEGTDTKTKLGALLKALGVDNSDDAIGKLTDMLKRSAELEAAMPELAELRAANKETQEKAEEGDVDEAIAAHNIPAITRDALLLYRRSNAKAFAEKYPKVRANERHLTTQLFSTAEGAPLGSRESGATQDGNGGRVLAANQRGTRVMLTASVGVTAEDLKSAEGRNDTERAMTLVRSHVPGADKMPFDRVHELGSQLLSQLRAS